MTTSEFIKILQDADPDGTAHVRLPGGGVPFAAEHKAGYWDGPYAYMDGNTYCITSLGSKVDVQVETPTDIVWDENGDMGRLRNRFRHNYSNHLNPDYRTDREKTFWDSIEKSAAIASEYHEKSLREWTDKVRKLIDQKGIDEFHFDPKTWMWSAYAEGVQVHGQLCGGEIQAVVESHLCKLTEDTPERRVYVVAA